MKKSLLILLLLLSVFLTSSCHMEKRDTKDAASYLKALKSYSVDTDIEVKNDRQSLNYDARQIFVLGLGYRLELDNDIIMVYKDDKIYVKDKKNQHKYVTDKQFDEVYRLSFLGEFLGLLYTNDKIDCSYVTKDNEEYELVRTSMPSNNRNISYGVLYIKVKERIPEKLIIYDSKNKIRLTVSYKNFNSNVEINRNSFNTD